jgi:IclR family KDG regulon transcriptional repressor
MRVFYIKQMVYPSMSAEYKPVPAIEKCFKVLALFAGAKKPLNISEISRSLDYHKSTVFHIVYTLSGLGILENGSENRFRLGRQLYVLGKAAGKESELIHTVRPYLERIAEETKLTSFLGVLSTNRVVIVDKVDSPYGIRVSSEIGLSIPLLAGAVGKVFLSQMSEPEVDSILSREKLKKYTPFSCTDVEEYKKILHEVRECGLAVDREEYIEGIRAMAAPIKVGEHRLFASMWFVGLSIQLKEEVLPRFSIILNDAVKEITAHFL